MFKDILSIKETFLTDDQRNKMLVDMIMNDRVSFPPKCDLGRNIKGYVKDSNVENNWYFDLDRIEHIKLFYFDSNNPSMFPQYKPAINYPKKEGYHQKQRKVMVFCKINDDVENKGSGGNLYIKDFNGEEVNVSLASEAGDLVIFPSFIPFKITPVFNDARVVYLQCIIQGLSFR